MPIPVVCPACGGKAKAPDKAAGRTLKCPQCQAPIRVLGPTDKGTTRLEPPPLERGTTMLESPSPRAGSGDSTSSPRLEANPSPPPPLPLPVPQMPCSSCGKAIRADSRFAGQLVACPHCSAQIQMPGELRSESIQRTHAVATLEPLDNPDNERSACSKRDRKGDDDDPGNKSSRPSSLTGTFRNLGLASGIVGIAGFAFSMSSYLPLAMPFSVAGLIVGILGVLGCSIVKNWPGISLSIIGIVMSVFSIAASHWMNDAHARRQEAVRRLIDNLGRNQRDEPPKIEPKPDPKPISPPKWTDAIFASVEYDDVRLTITKTEIGRIDLIDSFGKKRRSSDELLQVYIKIENTSKTKLMKYISLGTGDFGKYPILTDNFENQYRRYKVWIGDHVVGQIRDFEEVDPGKSISDVILFRPPIKEIEYLRLELPPAAFGTVGDPLRFQIPKAMIH